MDHLFHRSESRLARMLRRMARLGEEGKLEPVIPKVTQETLAEMISTTRSRVSYFMSKFRRPGFIAYRSQLVVRRSLRRVLLQDE